MAQVWHKNELNRSGHCWNSSVSDVGTLAATSSEVTGNTIQITEWAQMRRTKSKRENSKDTLEMLETVMKIIWGVYILKLKIKHRQNQHWIWYSSKLDFRIMYFCTLHCTQNYYNEYLAPEFFSTSIKQTQSEKEYLIVTRSRELRSLVFYSWLCCWLTRA